VEMFVDPELGGGGMNTNHWSCNDPKWICISCGWDGRACIWGSNQVLINWVDHEAVRTSDAPKRQEGRIQHEAGDFWAGSLSPVAARAVKAPALGAELLPTGAITVYDALGRKLNGIPTRDNTGLHGITLRRGVYFVQYRYNGTMRTERLIVKQ
jgi:hypothetical protein